MGLQGVGHDWVTELNREQIQKAVQDYVHKALLAPSKTTEEGAELLLYFTNQTRGPSSS